MKNIKDEQEPEREAHDKIDVLLNNLLSLTGPAAR